MKKISFMKRKMYIIYVKKSFVMIKIKKINLNNIKKLEIIAIIQERKASREAAHSVCNLRYKVQHEIPVIIHNSSKYDYHFIIKELAEEFKGQFECLGENTEKYITFSVPIKKENNDDNKVITYKIKFIDSCRFMQSTLSDLIDNLSERCMERKKIRSECEFIGFKDNRLNYKCKECNDISAKSVDV